MRRTLPSLSTAFVTPVASSSVAISTAIKRPLCLAISFICATQMAFAQANETKTLEEVIVTSQKRTQSLQDVPISVAAVTGDKIEKMGVENLEDLTAYVPNIHFTETGLSTQMRIRGIGSDNSQGFEQSVGVYKDGIYHSRAQLFRAPIFDVERVEVMRGPQSTLFGKNSIAGALDIITAKPTKDFEGQISASYESKFQTQEISGYVSGELSDNLQGRVAIRYYDDPGFMENTFKNTDEASNEEQSIRGSLAWQPSDNLDVLLVAEHNKFDVLGRTLEVSYDSPSQSDNIYFANKTHQDILQNVLPLLTAGLADGTTYDSTPDYRRQSNSDETSYNTIDSLTLRMDYHAGDYTITSLTGGLKFNYDEKCDCDFTPVNFFNLDMGEDYEQLSQEIRIVSPDDNHFTWIAGLFYQTYDQSFRDSFNIPLNSSLSPLVGNPTGLSGSSITRNFHQKSDTWALFAEGKWQATDRLSLTFGARFTEEKKEADKEVNIITSTDLTALEMAQLAGLVTVVFNTDTEQGQGHNVSASRSESAFTPALTVSYDLNDDIMTYAKVSKGFKAGGFDPRTNKSNRFEFEEESVVALELGSKMRFMEGRSELNLAIFHMDYEDLQVSQFDGAVGFNIGNANSTIVQGLEIDGRLQLSNNLMASYGFAFLDFEYDDFKNGNCYFGQTPTSQVGTDKFCDYSGKSGVYTPEMTLNVGLQHILPLGALELVSSLDAQWVDEQQVHVNLDPKGMIDSYTMLDARIALDAANWRVALLGKNLLDEKIISYSANLPLTENVFGTNSFYSFLRRPRTIAVEATYRF